MKTRDFYYELPESAIAQRPAAERDHSRLLALDGETGGLRDLRFDALTQLLAPGDLLVLNDSRVLPGRLLGVREGGGEAELLLLRRLEGDDWACLVRPGRRLGAGKWVDFPGLPLRAEVLGTLSDGQRSVRFHYEGDWQQLLERAGELPLPPYIHERSVEAGRYQTVYAQAPGSAAAPTAGLHFTPALLERLEAQGVELCYVTLHVGLGTFRPVRSERVEEHRMHAEHFVLSPEAAEQLNRARDEGRRIVACGTTSCRVLETLGAAGTRFTATEGESRIFIYPGYRFAVVDALITNFHLPESTLLMLVSAFAGRERVLAAYRHAIAAGYRFYSFGDAMFITPSAEARGGDARGQEP